MISLSVSMGKFTVTADGENIKDAIEAFSTSCAAEVFNEKCCGVCGCKDIIPKFRESQDPKNKKVSYKYYELVCTDPKCRAVLSLSQSKNLVSLFPQRKKKDAKGQPTSEYADNRGWHKFVKEPEDT